MFTALGIIMAVQDNRLNLDASLKAYLPAFTVQSRFSNDPIAEMTLKHLLSHTAGLPHEAPVGNNFNPTASSFKAHIKSIQAVWLRYPVEQRYAYSNLGYDLAGYILQQQYKIPFATYMEQYVLKPLGMHASTFDYQQIKQAPNIAIGAVPGFDEPVAVPMIPSGGLYTNGIDLGKFLQFQLNKGAVNHKPILTKAYIKLIEMIPFPHPGQEVGYGLGVMSMRFGDTMIYGHNGSGFGYNSTVIWIPDYNIGLAILLNGYANSALNETILQVVKLLRQAQDLQINTTHIEYPIRTRAKKFNPAWLGNYVRDNENTIQLRFADNQLGMVQNDKFTPVQYLGKDEFYLPERRTVYRYVPASKLQPAYVENIIDGTTWDYNDGSQDEPGPNNPGWKSYLGRYRIDSYKDKSLTATITSKNGYLYYNSYRLTEFKPGLYYAPDGYVLNLTGKNLI
jgi:CubicO group peptidase (beta-lactamase class C family)